MTTSQERMMTDRGLRIDAVAWGAWVLLGLWGAASAQAPTAAPPGVGTLDAQVAALAKRVLADPLDASVRDRLAELRRRQRVRDRAAYQALAQGLKALLEGGPELASPALRKAATSPRASALTEALPSPLERILKELDEAQSQPGRPKICQKCGNTGQADCHASGCYGSGMTNCPKCKGAGVVRPVAPGLKVPLDLQLCEDCGGTGSIRCENCGGAGWVRCTACNSRPADGSRPWGVAHAEAQKIREVIARARRLARGEIDVYGPEALKSSPK